MENEFPIPPCSGWSMTYSGAEHAWELVLRCRDCGFQIAAERHAHPYAPVRKGLQQAFRALIRSRRLGITTLLVLALLATPTPARGQEKKERTEVWALLDVAKTFSVPAETYIVATLPGIEVTRGPWAGSLILVFDRHRLIEQDVNAYWSRGIKRAYFTAGVGYFHYAGVGSDWTWSTSLQVPLTR